jgi:hypothetical protein
MTGNWRHWQPPSQPHSNELEHRVTATEVILEHTKEVCEERHEEAKESIEEVDKKHAEAIVAVRKRMVMLERAVLALATIMNVALQKEYPGIAKVIRGILMP